MDEGDCIKICFPYKLQFDIPESQEIPSKQGELKAIPLVVTF